MLMDMNKLTFINKSYMQGMAQDVKRKSEDHGASSDEFELQAPKRGNDAMMQKRKAKKKKRQAKLYKSIITLCTSKLEDAKTDGSISLKQISKIAGLKAEAENRLRKLDR